MKTIVNINLSTDELNEATDMVRANEKLFKNNHDMMLVLSNDVEILVMPRRESIILQTKVSLEM